MLVLILILILLPESDAWSDHAAQENLNHMLLVNELYCMMPVHESQFVIC